MKYFHIDALVVASLFFESFFCAFIIMLALHPTSAYLLFYSKKKIQIEISGSCNELDRLVESL